MMWRPPREQTSVRTSSSSRDLLSPLSLYDPSHRNFKTKPLMPFLAVMALSHWLPGQEQEEEEVRMQAHKEEQVQPLHLPPEITWDLALEHLDGMDLLNLALGCKAFHELLKSQLDAHTYTVEAPVVPSFVATPLIKHIRCRRPIDLEFQDQVDWLLSVQTALKRAFNVRRIDVAGQSPSVGFFRPVLEASRRCLREFESADTSGVSYTEVEGMFEEVEEVSAGYVPD